MSAYLLCSHAAWLHHGSVGEHVASAAISARPDHQRSLSPDYFSYWSPTLPGRMDREPKMVWDVCHLHSCPNTEMQSLYCVACREDFTLDNVEQKNQADILFNEALRMLQSMAQQNTNVVDRMKLMQISRNMVRLLLRTASTAASRWMFGSQTGFNRFRRMLAFTGCLSPASGVCSHGQEHPQKWKCHDQHGKNALMHFKLNLITRDAADPIQYQHRDPISV